VAVEPCRPFSEASPGEHRDPHLADKSLILKAGAHIEQGDAGPAVQALERANGLIDPERDPRLVLCIRHNLVDNLSKMGRYVEAANLLPELRELAAAQGGAMDHLRLNVPREALAAVLLFQEAAHREAASVELAREVAASISRARGGAAADDIDRAWARRR
jgi:hypothetical protein